MLAIITLIGVDAQFLLADAFGLSFELHVVLGRALGWWTLLLVPC